MTAEEDASSTSRRSNSSSNSSGNHGNAAAAAAAKSAHRKKRVARHKHSSPEATATATATATPTATADASAAPSSSPALPFALPPELAAKYFSNASSFSFSSSSSSSPANHSNHANAKKVFGPSPPPPKWTAAQQQEFAAAAAVVGSSGSPQSETEMQALMSMFVEIMGMLPVEQQQSFLASGSLASTTTTTGTTTHSGSNTTSFTFPSPASTSTNNTTSHSNGNSNSNSASCAFPVFSMMLGGTASSSSGGGKGKTGGANASTTTTNANITARMAASAASYRPLPPPPGGWPPGAAAAAAAVAQAAAAAGFPGVVDLPPGASPQFHSGSHGEWIMDYNHLDSEQHDHADADKKKPFRKSSSSTTTSVPLTAKQASKAYVTSTSHSASPSRGSSRNIAKGGTTKTKPTSNNEEDEDEDDEDDDLLGEAEDGLGNEEEERARKAAKKREKKNRRKEKAKKEAQAKAEEAMRKKREKAVMSWRSRVVTAVSQNDALKTELLLNETPFRQQDSSSNNSNADADDEVISSIQTHMTWLLPNCVTKSRITCHRKDTSANNGARYKLVSHVMKMAFDVMIVPNRNTGRSAMHTSAFYGDVTFFQLILDHAQHNKDPDHNKESSSIIIPQHVLEMTCEDVGWAPLHYATAIGSMELVELLLQGGANIHVLTDSILTCRDSTGMGVTPKELADILCNGTYMDVLECQGESLQEVVDLLPSDRASLKCCLDPIIARLAHVEEHGYSPPKVVMDTENKETSAPSSSTTVVKKKKKKKKKNQQQQPVEAESVATNEPPKTVSTPSVPQKREDPLVTSLLGMGFTSEQIHDAVEACGGTDRATADQLVMWILEKESGGGSSNNETDPTSAIEDPLEPSISNSFSDSMEMSKSSAAKAPPQDRISAQAQEASEAAKRRQEAEAAAQRLSAKREEQRRIRREWNNKEINRQKQEAAAKVMEEMERRKMAEMEKARLEAHRKAVQQLQAVASAGMVRPHHPYNATATGRTPTPYMSQQLQQQQHIPPIPPPGLFNSRQTSAPAHFLGDNVNGPFPDAPPGHSPFMRSQSQGAPLHGAYQGSPSLQPQQNYPSFGHEPSYGGDIVPLDYPELGLEPHEPPHAVMDDDGSWNLMYTANEDATVSSTGSGSWSKQRASYMNRAGSMKSGAIKYAPGNHAVEYSQTPPPGSFEFENSGSNMLPDTAPNPLGEIRATAKAFVPTQYASIAAAPISRSTIEPSALSSSLHPPMSPFGVSSNHPIHHEDEVSPEDAAAALLGPMSSLLTSGGNNMPTGSFLGSRAATSSFDRGSAGLAHASSFAHSPVPSCTSSVTGITAMSEEPNNAARMSGMPPTTTTTTSFEQYIDAPTTVSNSSSLRTGSLLLDSLGMANATAYMNSPVLPSTTSAPIRSLDGNKTTASTSIWGGNSSGVDNVTPMPVLGGLFGSEGGAGLVGGVNFGISPPGGFSLGGDNGGDDTGATANALMHGGNWNSASYNNNNNTNDENNNTIGGNTNGGLGSIW